MISHALLKVAPKESGTEEGMISHTKVVGSVAEDAVASPTVNVASPSRVQNTNKYSARVYLFRMIKIPAI